MCCKFDSVTRDALRSNAEFCDVIRVEMELLWVETALRLVFSYCHRLLGQLLYLLAHAGISELFRVARLVYRVQYLKLCC